MVNNGGIRGMWLTIPELAAELGYTTKTMYKIRSESPDRLPRSFRLPGSRKVAYMREEVENWLKDVSKKESNSHE